MRPRMSDDSAHTTGQSWQRALAGALRSREELCALLDLDPSAWPQPAGAGFPLRVPRSYVARMTPGDETDPLLLQVIPQRAEEVTTAGYQLDPVGDRAACVAPGVLHKYHGRVLLLATGVCPIHCRYCFSRHFAHERLDERAMLSYLAAHTDIREVVLSGGDPLSLSDARLATLVARLETIPHLCRLRIHTRMPIVLPERVDESLLGWLARGRLAKVMVLHVNHANELNSPALQRACALIRQTGVTLLNQSVLLHTINDRADTLIGLSEGLFQLGITPYYLHLLDPVQGAAHFAVPVASALAIMDTLRTHLPGYLVPHLVQEIAGAPAKTLVHGE